jgi:membrane carboxypeptidase/penicillin-binding protein
MPSASEIRRMRARRTDESRVAQSITRTAIVLMAAGVVCIAIVGVGGSLTYADLQRGLPAVDMLEQSFAAAPDGLIPPARFFDRTGDVIVEEFLHPLASERIWFSLPADTSSEIYRNIVSTTLAAQDDSFWSNPGFEWAQVLGHLGTDAQTEANGSSGMSITMQLAQYILQPVQDASIDVRSRFLRGVMLASRVNEAYTKEQILEWYLNSAYYGNLAYGIDAAALVYFGVHASDLTLAQAAMLASLPSNPELNPFDFPQPARIRQLEILQDMLQRDLIRETDGHQAMQAALNLRNEAEVRAGLQTSGFNAYAWRQMLAITGPQFMHRPGLRITTTLDVNLQLQVDCTARTHLARMQGNDPALVLEALDGTNCVSAASIPPLRPGDVGLDHRIKDASVVVIDPFSGEILSMFDTLGILSNQDASSLMVDHPHQLGSASYPFIYLTAFSRGLAPGTMVLDLPIGTSAMPDGDDMQSVIDWRDYHGPVSMRVALAGSYDAASDRALEAAGTGNVIRTTGQMGITLADAHDSPYQQVLHLRDAEATLIDMTFAYSVIANNGSMVGVDYSDSQGEDDSGSLNPISILSVEDALGNQIYQAEPMVRVVLSPQLAFLMADVLSDEVVRWDIYGQFNPLEIGRPAGVVIGTTDSAQDNWTVGFTPARAVGVWIGNRDEAMVSVGELNGSAPLWNALMRYSVQDLPLQGWSMPPGLNEMEVCYPSGLLPTLYCPTVVNEVFIHGTEPTAYDHLYKPFRVNKETGNLATLFTPLELVEERVYMVPPPEALEWARQVGIEQPPQEYDSIYVQPDINPEVNITSLEPFMYARGEFLIEGNANPEGFLYYRLQYGMGINPTRWTQLDEDIHDEVLNGFLGTWNTEGLNGLYTLQLVVVREGDRVDTAAVPLTIDNQPPLVQLVTPQDEQVFSRAADESVVIQAEASDETGLAQVAFYLDGRRISLSEAEPYSMLWDIVGIGEHTLFARAYDLAGNSAQTERVTIVIEP